MRPVWLFVAVMLEFGAPAALAADDCAGQQVAVGDHMACLKPGDLFQDFVGGPEMVVVPPGTFLMGSPESETGRNPDEGPQHEVKIGRSFAISIFEVTVRLWHTCHLESGCKFEPLHRGFGLGLHPAGVSWDEAEKFVIWINKKTGFHYRLPSEAEWEYSARAGTTTAYTFGATITQDEAQIKSTETAEVGSYAANAFGLYDVYGNVWEWVEDCYVNNYDNTPTDGTAQAGPRTCERVDRGGAWGDSPATPRSALRGHLTADTGFSALAFRIARDLTP